MKILFNLAVCGVSETGVPWAATDGDIKELSDAIGADMVKCGYGVLVEDEIKGKTKPKPKIVEA